MSMIDEMIDIMFNNIVENSKQTQTKQERIKALEEELKYLKEQVKAEEKGKEEFIKDIKIILQKHSEYLSNNPDIKVILENLNGKFTKVIF